MNQHLTSRIASIVIGSIIGIGLIVLGLKIFQGVFTRAEDFTPRDVVVSDITQNGIKASWTTGQDTQGVIEYGTSPTALNFFAPESAMTKNHSVDITLLSPNTTYYFQIRVADKKYDNGGVPWTFTTKGVEKTQPAVIPTVTKPTPVSSIVVPDAGAPAEPPAATCTETDCQKIKDKLGQGCTTIDYIKCLDKQTSTPVATTPAATVVP